MRKTLAVSTLMLLTACAMPTRQTRTYAAPPPPPPPLSAQERPPPMTTAPMPDDGYAILAPATGGSGVVPPVPAGPAMTQAELRRCVELDRSAKAGANEMAPINRSLTQRRAMIDEESARLEARRPTLDQTDPVEVGDFNRRVAELASNAARFNADTAREQTRVDAVNRQVNDYNSQCPGRRYRLSDMAAVAGDKHLRLGGPSPR